MSEAGIRVNLLGSSKLSRLFTQVTKDSEQGFDSVVARRGYPRPSAER